jgi:hypothetical protein
MGGLFLSLYILSEVLYGREESENWLLSESCSGNESGFLGKANVGLPV